MTNAWVITVPWFPAIYGVLLGLATLRAALPLIGPAPGSMVDPSGLDSYETAMLHGGERLAVIAAITELRQAGAIGPGQEARTIQATGQLPVTAHPVEEAVYARLAERYDQPFTTVRDEASSAPALTGLRDRLIQGGLLLNSKQARSTRLQSMWLLPVLALGLVWLAVGASNEASNTDSVGFFAVLMLASVGVLLWLMWWPLPLTRRGYVALKHLRQRHSALTPGRLYGPTWGAPSLAVALFGTAAFWAIDSDLAAWLSLPRDSWSAPTASAGGGGCGGGGCGGGGGGGCGGGGCGGGG
jgi:uncharacterized protein (TIGR04222 family)